MGYNRFLGTVSDLTDNENTAKKYAEHLSELFDVIDAEKIGDDFVRELNASNFSAAVCLLAKYYREKADFNIPEISAKGKYDVKIADRAAEGSVRVINIDWTFSDRDIDFLFDPTEINGPRNHEWLWQNNRHNYWVDMSRAYADTGDEKYARAFRSQLLKWIAQTYIPNDWNGPGSAWRTIECGLRLLGTWQIAYDGFRKSVVIDDVTLLLFIASMHRQAIHLINNPTWRNWIMMEMNGVYTFSALFNELADSEQNRRRALAVFLDAIEKQILPDGMHNELTPDYQSVVYNCASNFYTVALKLGFENEIPSMLGELLRKTVNAAILLSTPAFTQPRTNDTYTIKTQVFTRRAAEMFGESEEYGFVNTERAGGSPPKGETASAFLDYAGFAVMRSDWGADAAYLCFDVGPLGASHIHQDMLNIIVYKGNQELIYDDGGGQYEFSPLREYARLGYGHNTVLVDGLTQYRNSPKQSERAIDAGWISNASFDYAHATYNDTFGEELLRLAAHKREVRFCKPDFFCVSDTLTSVDGQKHDYELLFHLDTTETKSLCEYENGVISVYGKKYEVAIIPVDEQSSALELNVVSAVTEPRYQGWYNGRNDENIHAATTVSRTVKGVENYRFTTLIFPIAEGQELPKIEREADVIKVDFNGKEYRLALGELNC